MNRVRLFTCCAVAVVLGAAIGCSGRNSGERHATAFDTHFEKNKDLFAAIGKAEELILYEGLPHPAHEPDRLAEELQNKETVKFNGFSFYRVTLEVSADEKENLRKLLGSESSFKQWRSPKACGGYHPDYCAEWRVGDAVYRVLICLGCSEVAIHGPGGNLYCDIQIEAKQQLKDLLRKHRKNRPPWEMPP